MFLKNAIESTNFLFRLYLGYVNVYMCYVFSLDFSDENYSIYDNKLFKFSDYLFSYFLSFY